MRVLNAPEIGTFHLEDIALKSGNSDKDRQFSGEPAIPLSKDTIMLSLHKQTRPLMPKTKKQKSIFNFDNLMKIGIGLMGLFGLYAIGGLTLLLLSGIGITTIILLFTLGIIPSNILEKPKVQVAQVKRAMTGPLTSTRPLIV